MKSSIQKKSIKYMTQVYDNANIYENKNLNLLRFTKFEIANGSIQLSTVTCRMSLR